MLYNLYQSIHSSTGLCFWDVPTLILLAVMVVVAVGHYRNHKKRQEAFEAEGSAPTDVAGQ